MRRRRSARRRSRRCWPAEPRTAEADQHLLQPGRRRITGFRSPALPPADGQLADVEGAGGVSPLDAPARSAPRRRCMPNGWFRTITAEISAECAGGGALAVAAGLARRRGPQPTRPLVPYEIVGDAIPASLTGAPAIRRAAARSSATAGSGCACCAMPARFRRSGSRARWRRISRASGRAGRRSAPAAPGRRAGQPGYDHAPLLPHGGPDPGRPALPGKPILTRRADRGCGRLSRDLDAIGAD